MDAYWADHFAGRSDDQLGDDADHYAQSFNWPMLAHVQREQAARRTRRKPLAA